MHIVLQGVVGSTAYGLNGPDSDIDRLGVFAHNTQRIFSLAYCTADESHVSHNPDVAMHEAAKFAKLALNCNPAVTELLYLEAYDVRTPLGADLIAIRSAFLAASRVRKAYLGYASEQFRRLLRRGDGSFSSDTRKRTAKHARHLMRLVDQGYELYTTGTVTVRLAEPEKYLSFGEQVAAEPAVAAAFMAQAEERFSSAPTVLPEEARRPVVQAWINRVRAAYYAPAEQAARA